MLAMKWVATILSFLAVAPLAVAQIDATAGATSKLSVAGLAGPVLVQLPVDYDGSTALPVFFAFHDMAGQPHTLLSLASGKRGMIYVGMTYEKTGFPMGDQAEAMGVWTYCTQVRDELAKSLKIDAKRTYVGGYGKGGWAASMLADALGDELAGVVMLNAGRARPGSVVVEKKLTKARPMFIGIVRDSHHIVASRAAKEHFAAQGWEVSFKVFEEKGEVIEISQPMRNWFGVELARGNDEAQKRLAGQFEVLLELYRGLPAPDRYLALRDQLDQPLVYAIPQAREQIQEMIRGTIEHPAVRQLQEVESAYATTMSWEVQQYNSLNPNLKVLARIGLDYTKIAEEHPQTPFGRHAAVDAARVLDKLKRIKAQQDAGG